MASRDLTLQQKYRVKISQKGRKQKGTTDAESSIPPLTQPSYDLKKPAYIQGVYILTFNLNPDDNGNETSKEYLE